MRIKQWIVVLISLFLTQSTFAYYCSTRQANGFISVGDTMDQVRKACGDPTEEGKPSLYQDSQLVTTQYWVYENTQVSNTNVLAIKQTRVVTREAPTVVVEITEGKVTNITQGGNEAQSGYCASMGNTIQIGDSIDQVNAACGNPTYMNTEQHQKNTSPPQEKVIWTYQWEPYTQPLKLEFIGGKLTNIEG